MNILEDSSVIHYTFKNNVAQCIIAALTRYNSKDEQNYWNRQEISYNLLCGRGRVWQVIGLAGTAVFVILFYLSRFHLLSDDNLFGGMSQGGSHNTEFPRGSSPGGFQIGALISQIEICQFVFIGLYAALTKMYHKNTIKQ